MVFGHRLLPTTPCGERWSSSFSLSSAGFQIFKPTWSPDPSWCASPIGSAGFWMESLLSQHKSDQDKHRDPAWSWFINRCSPTMFWDDYDLYDDLIIFTCSLKLLARLSLPCHQRMKWNCFVFCPSDTPRKSHPVPAMEASRCWHRD